MELVIILMLSVLIVLNILSLIARNNNNDCEIDYDYISSEFRSSGGKIAKYIEKIINESEKNQLREISNNQLKTSEITSKKSDELKESVSKSLNENFTTLTKKVDERLDKINTRVEERLNEGFEKTNKTFSNILERLSKIDEAQKKIDSLSTDIVSLQDVLTDKKSRGTFGEVQLNHILAVVFGEKNDKIYEIQKKLSSSNIVDSVIHMPEPVGMICVDSKFPLENYQRMIDVNCTEVERKQYTRDFKINIKKHINDISSKYIIQGETSNQAIMFIPAEAIFAEINAYHQDLIDYAAEKGVRIASPTTLMAILSIVQIVLRNIEREKYTGIIHEQLSGLGEEFRRYKERWDSLAKDIEKVTEDVRKINTTSNKIEEKFSKISKVEIKGHDEHVERIVAHGKDSIDLIEAE